MSRPLSRPEAEAARIKAEAEAEAWRKCVNAATGHDPLPDDESRVRWDEAAEERVDRHISSLDDLAPTDTRNEQARYDNWLERETP